MLAYAGSKTILDDYLRGVRPRYLPRPRPSSASSTGRAILQIELLDCVWQVPLGHGQTRKG
jgi:hypothetical protein